jgi:hypothetical protein
MHAQVTSIPSLNITQQRVSETNMFRNQNKVLIDFLLSKLVLLETRVSELKQSLHHNNPNKHARGPIDQVIHSVHLARRQQSYEFNKVGFTPK